MRAAVYCRISSDREGTGLGVTRQEADCRALCERNGWEVVDVLVDNDRSAYSGKKRPAYEKLVGGLAAKVWDVVVAWHPDRLHRSPKELEHFIDVLEAAGAQVVTVTAGTWDLSTPSGRAIARTLGAWARYESEHKAERLRRKHQELAESGADSGGERQFGYQADRVTIDDTEAALIRDAAQRVLDGSSVRAIVVAWNAQGVRTTLGNDWSSVSLKRLLTSPRVAGFREYGGQMHRAVWTPILDEVTWRRVRAVLLDPTRWRMTIEPRSYLLTGGIARCGLVSCGAPLVARPKADKRRCYVCASPPNFRGCGKIRILADPFEQDVCDRVLARIEAGRVPSPFTPPDVTALLAKIEAKEASLAELSDDYYVHRSVTKAQFQSSSSRLLSDLDALRSQVGEHERIRARAAVDLSVVERWDRLEIPDRRPVIETMVEAVRVLPAVKGRNFYDENRVVIDWRS